MGRGILKDVFPDFFGIARDKGATMVDYLGCYICLSSP